MNTFLELAQQRQSDRAFHDKAIEPEKIERILEAARLAPSACNAQPWKIIVVDDPEKKELVANSTSSKIVSMNHFSKQAPVQLVLIEEKANFTSSLGSLLMKKHLPQIDMGIVASHICLAAADEGLGTCMLGWCDQKKVKTILDIPNDKKVVMIILLGYSKQEVRTKIRKPIEQITSHNSYK